VVGVGAFGRNFPFDYLEVPVLAKLAFLSGDVTPVLYSGPSAALKVHPFGEEGSAYVAEASWVFGGGLEFVAGERAILLDVRYTRGLTFVWDFNDPSDSDSDDKHQGISVAIGIGL
jgi:hypothetical protein